MITRQMLNTAHGDCIMERAAKVVDDINEWLHDTESFGVMPTASMLYTGSYISISIGEEIVWDTEDCENDNMSLFGCLRKWRDELNFNKPFIEKLAAFDKSLNQQEPTNGQ